MARVVMHKEQHPMEVKPGNESKWICRCGLSATQPFCNGAHKKTHGEEEGKVYQYDDNGNRAEVEVKKKK